jgi:hypothetical protein
VVQLPPEQCDPRYAYVRRARSTNFWFRFKKVHFVKCLYMLCDFHFMGISFMTAVNILALLLTHEGAKLLLVVRNPCCVCVCVCVFVCVCVTHPSVCDGTCEGLCAPVYTCTHCTYLRCFTCAAKRDAYCIPYVCPHTCVNSSTHVCGKT